MIWIYYRFDWPVDPPSDLGGSRPPLPDPEPGQEALRGRGEQTGQLHAPANHIPGVPTGQEVLQHQGDGKKKRKKKIKK